MKQQLLLWVVLLSTTLTSAQVSRIESEYKLGIPNDQADDLWEYLQSESFLAALSQEKKLTTVTSIEEFYDIYFDDEAYNLYKQSLGLRHRSRYVRDTLVKQLIQVKTPISEDGVARNEYKYEVRLTQSKDDMMGRHPFYSYVKKRDRQDIKYLMSRFEVDDLSLSPSVELKQIRKRIYISDSIGSVATATLDEVIQHAFPFLKFTEMELELNEIRYTDADEVEKLEMEQLNQKLKDALESAFPDLKQDQTPKYNKMKNKIDSSLLSNLYKNRMWVILLVLVCWAGYLWIRKK